jgi:hypothetical protein
MCLNRASDKRTLFCFCVVPVLLLSLSLATPKIVGQQPSTVWYRGAPSCRALSTLGNKLSF